MPTRVSSRTAAVEPFLAMEVAERAFQMQRDGVDVIHLEIGEPDFRPPPAAIDAAAEALAAGVTRYTDSRGDAELRAAIAEVHSRRAGTAITPEQVIVTTGSSSAMLLVFSLLIDPGDEVIVGTPHYPCYPNFIRYCGGEPVLVPTDPQRGYQLDIDAVRAARTERTRAVVVNSPANPTGAIQGPDTLRALADLGLPLVSDEIYDGIVYGDAPVTSAARVSEQAFVIDGFSKRYAMTGFRLGYAIVPPDAMRPLQVLQQNLFICANSFVQRAGIAALRRGAEQVEDMRSAYRARRDLLLAGLRQLGFRVPVEPQGAFYVFADARGFGGDSRVLAFEILERAHVGVTPGVDFGAAGEGWLRFCYAVSKPSIEEALERLERVLPELA
ncbi:MAG: pyridoxal phosphate-dependent aminotransferase [Myxococcota bacterium]